MELNPDQICVSGFFTEANTSIVEAIFHYGGLHPNNSFAIIEHDKPCDSFVDQRTHYHYVVVGGEEIRDLQAKLHRTIFKNIQSSTPGFKSSCKLYNFITKHTPPQVKLDSQFLIKFLKYAKHNGPDTKITTNRDAIKDYFDGISEDEAIDAKCLQVQRQADYQKKKEEALSTVSVPKRGRVYHLPPALTPKYEIDVELDNFVRDFNLVNQNATWRLSKKERKFMDIKYNKEKVKEAIERYGNEMSKEGFKFTRTDGKEGLPFRYFALASYLADDKFEGRTHKDFMERPKNHLSSGVLLLIRVLFENLKDKACHFIEDLEQILNKTYDKKTVMCIIGASNSGKTLISSMVTSYVNTGLITRNGEASQFVFSDLIDKRICHMEEAKVAQTLEGDYLSLFSKNDTMQVQVKHKEHVVLNDRSCKPAFIMTANADPFRDCVQRHAFDNRVVKYWFNEPMDQTFLLALKESTSYPNNIPITPMHYLIVISILQNLKQINPHTIDDYIEKNNFIELFKNYVTEGYLDLQASFEELDVLFNINMPHEKKRGLNMSASDIYIGKEVVTFDYAQQTKRELEEEEDDETVETRKRICLGIQAVLAQKISETQV